MNGTEKIIARILSDADAQTEKILAEARAFVADQAAETARECTALVELAKSEAEKNAQAILLRAESSAAMDTRRTLLLAKAAMLDRAYEEAEKAFLASDDDTRLRFCIALTARAIECVLGEEEDLRARYGEDRASEGFSVILSERDLAAFGDTFLGQFLEKEGKNFTDARVSAMTLSRTGGAFGTGIILSCGEYEHNATLPMLLSSHRNDREQEVYRLLFPSD